MKKVGILVIYFLFLCVRYFLDTYDEYTLKITTIFSKIGDAVLVSSHGSSKFLLLGGIDYGLDRYLGGSFLSPCLTDYVYILFIGYLKDAK